jgi:hypothetical protein
VKVPVADVPVEHAVEVAAELGAERLEDLADVVRDAPGRDWSLAGAAFLVGAGVGGGVAYFLVNRLLKTKYQEIADGEIEEMREHYLAKGRALEAQKGKGELSEIVKEKGYASPEPTTSASPPMAVQPPSSVMASEDEAAGEPPDDSEMAVNSVEGANGVKTRNIFRETAPEELPQWDLDAELKRRGPDRPYVIHRDEIHDTEGYDNISFTYYATDDVLCNERDEVIDPADRDNLVGEANLDRFGHGSGDPAIVYIRNDNLEIMYEIVRSPNSYAEEVHGFRHEAWDRGNLERMRRRERDHGDH